MDYIEVENVVCEICNKEDETYLYCKTKDYSYKSCNNVFVINFCKRCDVLFLQNQPVFKEYNKIYNSNYKAYAAINKNVISFFFRFATFTANLLKYRNLNKFLKQKDLKILEIGPGNGQLITIIKKFNSIDYKNISLIETNKELSNRYSKLGYKSYNCSFEEFETNDKFDLIIANQVLEHLKSPVKILNKFNKLLNRNGVIFIETPNFDCLENKLFNKKYWGGLHAPRHTYLYNANSLKKIFNDNGFKLLDKNYILSPYTLYETIKNIIFKEKNNFFVKLISIYNPIFLLFYCFLDLLQILIIGKNSNIRVVFVKDK